MSRDTVSVDKQLGNGEDAVIMFTLESRWRDMDDDDGNEIHNWQVSRQFLDTRELGNSPKSLANLHNNQVMVMIGDGDDW